jgi:hypothetical protein
MYIQRLVDQARHLIRIPSYRPRAARRFPATHYGGEGCPRCPRPFPRFCNNSTASTGPYLSFKINSTVYSMGRNMFSVCGTFKRMIWCGWLTIWTGYVLASPSSILLLGQRRFSVISILPVPRPENVYANSEVYAAPRGYSQHRTPFHLISSPLIPTHSPREVMATCTREPSMVQGFALNVCGCMLKMDQKRLSKCVIDVIAFPVTY